MPGAVNFGNVQMDSKTGTVRIAQKQGGVDELDILEKQNAQMMKYRIEGKDANDQVVNKYAPKVKIEAIDKNLTLEAKAEESLKLYQKKTEGLRGKGFGALPAGALVKVAASATANTSANPADIFQVSGSDYMPPGSYNIRVNALAQKDMVQSTTGVASSTAALGWVGDLTVQGTVIPVTADMTLTSLIDAINLQTTTTGITASAIKVSGTDYRLVFESSNYATPITVAHTLPGVTTEMPATSAATVDSLSAEVVFRGVTVKRTSNDITDLLPNATLILKKADPATTVNLAIERSIPEAIAAIQEWIDAHNAFIKDNLHKDSKLGETLWRDIQMKLPGLVAGIPDGSPASLSAIGIKIKPYERKGEDGTIRTENTMLEIDTTPRSDTNNKIPLEYWLGKDVDKVSAVIGFAASTTNSDFSMMKRPIAVPAEVAANTTTVSLTKSGDGSSWSATVTRNGDGGGTVYPLGISASGDILSLEAPADSPFAGFTFSYIKGLSVANGATVTTQMKLTQGVLDAISQRINGAFQKTGDLPSLRDRILNTFKQDKTRAEEAVTDITSKLDAKKNAAMKKVGLSQNARTNAAQVNALLDQMKADAMNAF